MSLCRWSSDDWQCELYVYGAEHGWYIHVAASRFDPPEDFPRTPPYPEGVDGNSPVPATSPEFREWVSALLKVQVAQGEYFDRVGGYSALLRPIGGIYDGDTFSDLDNQELVDHLTVLQEAGYRFPEGVLEEARVYLAEEGPDYEVALPLQEGSKADSDA